MGCNSIVYVLTNEFMPNLVKVGMTTVSAQARANDISKGTGVPGQWVVAHSFNAGGFHEELEMSVHQALRSCKVKCFQAQEIFECSVDKAIEVIANAFKQCSKFVKTYKQSALENNQVSWSDHQARSEEIAKCSFEEYRQFKTKEKGPSLEEYKESSGINKWNEAYAARVEAERVTTSVKKVEVKPVVKPAPAPQPRVTVVEKKEQPLNLFERLWITAGSATFLYLVGCVMIAASK